MFANDLTEPRFRVFRHILVYLGQQVGASESFLEKYRDDYSNEQYLKGIGARKYDSNDDRDLVDMLVRLVVFGKTTFRNIAGFNPSDSTYDYAHGVRIYYDLGGKAGEIVVADKDTVDNLPHGSREQVSLTGPMYLGSTSDHRITVLDRYLLSWVLRLVRRARTLGYIPDVIRVVCDNRICSNFCRRGCDPFRLPSRCCRFQETMRLTNFRRRSNRPRLLLREACIHPEQ
jgi:hypothetical protein